MTSGPFQDIERDIRQEDGQWQVLHLLTRVKMWVREVLTPSAESSSSRRHDAAILNIPQCAKQNCKTEFAKKRLCSSSETFLGLLWTRESIACSASPCAFCYLWPFRLTTLQTRSSVAEKARGARAAAARFFCLLRSLKCMHARGCADRFSWTKGNFVCECGHELYTTCGAASSPPQGRHTRCDPPAKQKQRSSTLVLLHSYSKRKCGE